MVGDFGVHLDRLPESEGRLVAFLGGTIGNLTVEERARFLTTMADRLRPGEGLLIGVDLVKDPARLVAAYDDGAGVTADFERTFWRWSTPPSTPTSTSPLRLRRPVGQPGRADRMGVRVRGAVGHGRRLGLSIELADGEEIGTEISAKFRRDGITSELEAAGFVPMGWWTDSCGDFAVTLAQRADRAAVDPFDTLHRPRPRGPRPRSRTSRYRAVRAATEALAAPLSPEDQTVQTMPDVSPTKWHRAHVTWFFERFVLMPYQPGYRPVDDRYLYLWNSYYEGVGPGTPGPNGACSAGPAWGR